MFCPQYGVQKYILTVHFAVHLRLYNKGLGAETNQNSKSGISSKF